MKCSGTIAASRTRVLAWACAAAWLFAGSLAVLPVPALAQQTQQKITPNFKDADITMIAEAVSAATGKNFIIEPRVRAQVTMLSSTPMSPDAFYQAFLSILQVHGFVAMPAGDVVKIVPDANARTMPGDDLPDRVSRTSDEIVTQVIQVKNVNAAQLVPILRSLIPQNGHLAAYQPSNILIISDRAANVNRIQRIIARIDQAGDSDVEIVPLQNASAAEIVRVITTLFQAQQAQEGGANPMKLVADERSNSVLVSGDPSQRLRIKTLIAHLDTPLQSGGDTQVRYLRYADAEKIAPKLKEQITGMAQAAAPAGAGGAATPAAQADKATQIWAEPETNALVITAPPKTMRSIMAIIDKLDIRRMQVLVEAIIVDVSQSKSAALGVNWAAYSNESGTNIPIGTFNSPIGSQNSGTVSLTDVAKIAANPTAALAAGATLPTGALLGIGRIVDNGVNFAAILRAVRSDADSNIIATPSAITMDNQEAQLKVAQEVPFITGQFTNTGAAAGSVNPFQTVQREEVGTILKVTPQLNGGSTVILKLEIESSSLAQSSAGAVDLITNKRTVSTNVMIEDGGIVVLGGLISDNSSRGESRVPFLGRIPLIGLAFKTRNSDRQKTNLMIFIRPKILRDGVQAAYETDAKYNYIVDEQKKAEKRELLPLLPGRGPQLPPMPPAPQGEDATETDPRVQQEIERRKRLKEEAEKQSQSQGAQPQGAPAPQATPAPTPPPADAPPQGEQTPPRQ
ncbi:MAG TPA: type II secretion system secretin GspD [Steroidobacteraceae bacterium]|nr:type II secretion system secretin GspD [Steroidobacteraceae bacterium]